MTQPDVPSASGAVPPIPGPAPVGAPDARGWHRKPGVMTSVVVGLVLAVGATAAALSWSAQDDPGGSGTLENPLPAGTEVMGVDDAGRHVVTIVLERADWDADDIAAAPDTSDEPAPAGVTYVVLPVTFTNVSSAEPLVPWIDVEVAYVAPDRRAFERAPVVGPDGTALLPELAEGQTATGSWTFAIPTGALGGVWSVSYDHSEPVYVAAE